MTPRAGVLVVDKPAGPSSAQVVARVKRALRADKVGHTGTLDPMATGVLPVVIGEATKVAGWLLADDKEYDGELELGLETDTLDITGTPTASGDATLVSRAALLEAMAALTGTIQQVPPAVSALKQNGRPLYELVRRGIEVHPDAREVTVEAFALVDFMPPRARFHVACSKGTYVRSLVRDVGRALGCGATLTALRRTRAGAFDLTHAVALDDVDASAAARLVRPAAALAHLPAIVVDDPARLADVRQGRRLPTPPEAPAGPVRLLDGAGELLAIAEVIEGRLSYHRVLHPH